MSVPGRGHPLRSDPALGAGLGGALGLLIHVVAILGAMVSTAIVGLVIGSLGALTDPASTGGSVVAAIGVVLSFSVLFSWIGHLLGAPILHILIQRGLAGWLSVMLAGAVVCGVLAPIMGTWLVLVLGPILALIHGAVLRLLCRLRTG